ncbi:MAG: glycosyl transferase family protein, partial [Chloroflexi bacterium]|nr:glycosyl transferase family protein [Chloroflexota bacterium]
MEIDYLPVYPPLHLDHLERLSDSTGIIQHALHSVPDPTHGYSIDDQARALIVHLAHAHFTGANHPAPLAYTFMSFLRHAANPDGTFHNFLSYSRQWLDEQGSEDSHGRALWALGYATRYGIERGMIGAAADLFDVGKAHIDSLRWPRSWAFSLFGVYHRLKAAPDDDLQSVARTLAGKLVDCFEVASGPDWLWFEDELTYCNAKLPAALLLA